MQFSHLAEMKAVDGEGDRHGTPAEFSRLHL
jgi:hypothetical protein